MRQIGHLIWYVIFKYKNKRFFSITYTGEEHVELRESISMTENESAYSERKRLNNTRRVEETKTEQQIKYKKKYR